MLIPPSAAVIMSEKIPKAMAEKFAAITRATDAFSPQRLNEEYRKVIHRLLAPLAKKLPSSLVRGKENVCAAAALHAVGRSIVWMRLSQHPTAGPKPSTNSSGPAKAPGRTSPRRFAIFSRWDPWRQTWTLPSRLADNPLVWMIQVNGLIIDISGMPIELSRRPLRQV